MSSKVVVLLSGGLDSATTLAIARAEGHECLALTADYGQRHIAEIDSAQQLASIYASQHEVVRLGDFGRLAQSALTNRRMEVPKDRPAEELREGIPATYVPARNLVLLSIATAWAEAEGAHSIFAGFNVLDASGYPDCREQFVKAFESAALAACRPGRGPVIRTPLIRLTKAEIIMRGYTLRVDYALTHTCYDPKYSTRKSCWQACGRCDACQLRRRGFEEAGVPDPTRYV